MYHKDLLPLDYPWVSERRAVLLNGEDEYPLVFAEDGKIETALIQYDEEISLPLDEFLAVKSKARIFDRIPVVAIGSNASPLVTRSKISRYGMRGTTKTVPMFPATMKNMGVGYSGHFVSGGYIPAAPYHDEGGELEVTVSFLTREQMYAIDSTEPTYRRELVSKELYPVTLPNGEVLDAAYIYATRFGVLRGVDGFPIPLASQASLYSLLHESGVGRGFFRGESQNVSDRIAGKGIWAANRITAKDVFEGIIISDGITVEDVPVESVSSAGYRSEYDMYWERLVEAEMAGDMTPSEEEEFMEQHEHALFYEKDGTFGERYYHPLDKDYPEDEELFLDKEWLEVEELADEAMRDAANDEWLSADKGDWLNTDFDARYDAWWQNSGRRNDAIGF